MTMSKELIKRIFHVREFLKGSIKVAYLENYDIELGRTMTSGVDVWLNTPQPPLEASGTSGMKAALNGVPSLSVMMLDGLKGVLREQQGGAWERTSGSPAAAVIHRKMPPLSTTSWRTQSFPCFTVIATASLM